MAKAVDRHCRGRATLWASSGQILNRVEMQRWPPFTGSGLCYLVCLSSNVRRYDTGAFERLCQKLCSNNFSKLEKNKDGDCYHFEYRKILLFLYHATSLLATFNEKVTYLMKNATVTSKTHISKFDKLLPFQYFRTIPRLICRICCESHISRNCRVENAFYTQLRMNNCRNLDFRKTIVISSVFDQFCWMLWGILRFWYGTKLLRWNSLGAEFHRAAAAIQI